MTKFIILYWEPGSCGDLVQSLLLSDGAGAGVIDSFDLNDGRVIPSIDQCYLQLFPAPSNQWYHRNWSDVECHSLIELCDRRATNYFVIPTHNRIALDYLRAALPNSASVGVTYSTHLYPFVLKNWCKKTVNESHNVNLYNSKIHQYIKQKNVYAEFVFKEKLLHGSEISKAVLDHFDFAIGLEKLLVNDLSDINTIIPDCVIDTTKYQAWLDQQNILFRYQFPISEFLKSIIGYNSLATMNQDLDYQLDLYDKIMIQTQVPQVDIKNVRTLFELDNLMKTAKYDN